MVDKNSSESLSHGSMEFKVLIVRKKKICDQILLTPFSRLEVKRRWGNLSFR
jgi:hypothetical protein